MQAQTSTTDDGQMIAKLVLSPIQRIIGWSIIGLILLVLGTAGTVGVLVALQESNTSRLDGHDDSLRAHDEAFSEIVATLERITTKLDAMEKWSDSVDLSDRYTSQNAEADRLINVTARGQLAGAMENLRERLDEHVQKFSDHRAEQGHPASNARITALEARMNTLEASVNRN